MARAPASGPDTRAITYETYGAFLDADRLEIALVRAGKPMTITITIR